MAKEQTILHEWLAPEYQHYPKNLAWYITFIAVVVLLVGFQLIQGDIFGGICLAILGGLILFFASQPPKVVGISITQKGVHLDEIFLPFNKIQHFWIVDDPNHKTLNLRTSAILQKIVVIELADQDPEEIRETLQDLLPEISKEKPTLSQKIIHWLNF